jgi:hypothetical protein
LSAKKIDFPYSWFGGKKGEDSVIIGSMNLDKKGKFTNNQVVKYFLDLKNVLKE